MSRVSSPSVFNSRIKVGSSGIDMNAPTVLFKILFQSILEALNADIL